MSLNRLNLIDRLVKYYLKLSTTYKNLNWIQVNQHEKFSSNIYNKLLKFKFKYFIYTKIIIKIIFSNLVLIIIYI